MTGKVVAKAAKSGTVKAKSATAGQSAAGRGKQAASLGAARRSGNGKAMPAEGTVTKAKTTTKARNGTTDDKRVATKGKSKPMSRMSSNGSKGRRPKDTTTAAGAGRTGPADALLNANGLGADSEGNIRMRKGRAKVKGEAGVGEISLPAGYRPSETEPFMNPQQREYFRNKLLAWKEEILRLNRETLQILTEDSAQHADISDRATFETDRALELRARDRQRKLVSKIDSALARIEDGSYGYCEETGEPISLKRLDARPIATLSIEAQERHERRERVFRED